MALALRVGQPRRGQHELVRSGQDRPLILGADAHPGPPLVALTLQEGNGGR
jgi:hypothetical protein